MYLETSQGKKLFNQYLKKFAGKSSQKVYKSEVRQFFAFHTGDLADLTKTTFLKYREHLGQNVTAKTIKRKFSILNGFFKFAETKVKDFTSPIGTKYGDMRAFQAADYVDSDTFKTTLEQWRESLICESTKKTYIGHVTLFFKWAGREPKDLKQGDFTKYRDHLLVERELKTSTIWTKFIAINGFFKFLAVRNRRFTNPIDFKGLKLVPPKKDKGYYGTLTPKEAKKLRRQPDKRTLIGKRDRAIIQIMLTYGLRANEICRLTFGDLEPERIKGQQKIWIRDRKGRIGRRADTDIILSGRALDAFDDWMTSCGYRFRATTPIFLPFTWDMNSGGLVINMWRAREDAPLTTQTIENIINKYVLKAKIDPGNRVISPHALRHTAFTLLAREGIKLVDLKHLAGHQDVATTMIYLHHAQSYDDHVGMHNPLNK